MEQGARSKEQGARSKVQEAPVHISNTSLGLNLRALRCSELTPRAILSLVSAHLQLLQPAHVRARKYTHTHGHGQTDRQTDRQTQTQTQTHAALSARTCGPSSLRTHHSLLGSP
jgi:hypothetical protein